MPDFDPKSFIDFDAVDFTYDGEHPVLQDMNLQVPQGQFLCLLGGNGSGKSTMAKCIDALLVPDKGEVRLFGRSTSDASETYFIRSNAGMVFQNPDDQLVASLVEDDVAFGPENLGIENPELALAVEGALEAVGMEGFGRRETQSLSGGQKQRVAIAGVLAMDPAVLVLDEATAMLDPRGREGLLKVCARLHDEGMTIVMITHYMDEAVRADRVAVLDRGRIILDGSPECVLAMDEELAALNLDAPFAVHLSRLLQARGVNVLTCADDGALLDQLAQIRVGERAAFVDMAALTDPAAGDTAAFAPLSVKAPKSYGEVLLRFEDVSFTYAAAAKRKNRRNRRRSGVADAAASATSPAAKADGAAHASWGNDPAQAWALRHVDLTVRRGEFLGIAGHTGSGKSTLIQHMNGLLAPTEGAVMTPLGPMADKAVAQAMRCKVGLVFQYPEHQLFADTVFDDVAFGPRNMGLPAEEVARRVRRAMEAVGLDYDAVAARSPFKLSGGQQRRVAFAGVLAMEPDVLVMDEPVAGLDPRGREEFLSLIEKLHGRGYTCVLVSHSMDDLARLCDRIAVLNRGAVYREGTPEEVFSDEESLRAVGLDVPAAQAFALRLGRDGWPMERRLYDGCALADAIARNLAERPHG